MKKIRIGCFIDYWRPGAGTEHQLETMLKNLDPDRFEAKLITLREEIPANYRQNIPWPIECLKVNSLASFDGLTKFVKLVGRMRREKFDIVMIYFIDSNLFVTPASWLAGVSSIVVNRRDLGYWYNPKILRPLNFVNRLSDYFLVNSRAIKEVVIKSESFPADRIKVIYNTLRDIPPRANTITRESLGIPSSAPIVGIVANLRPVKRIDWFLDTAALIHKKVNDCHFLILGGGELEDELKGQAEKLDLHDKVQFLGQVADVFSYLDLFDAGLLTSESEGLSNTLVEYQQVGVVPIAFDVGGNKEIISDGLTGFIVPRGDTGKLADRVLEILADDNLKQKLASAGEKSAQELFEPEKISNQMTDFFETITWEKGYSHFDK